MKYLLCEEGCVQENVEIFFDGRVIWYRGTPPLVVGDDPPIVARLWDNVAMWLLAGGT